MTSVLDSLASSSELAEHLDSVCWFVLFWVTVEHGSAT